MILELTEMEQNVLIGILEDESQEEDVRDVYTIQDRIAIKSIILKLGGTFFGNL